MATKKQLAEEISQIKGIEIDPNQYYRDELEEMLEKLKIEVENSEKDWEDVNEEISNGWEEDWDEIDEEESTKAVEEIINEVHKPKEKKITGVDYAEMFALGSRAIFYIKKKYGLQTRTIQEWQDAFRADGLI